MGLFARSFAKLRQRIADLRRAPERTLERSSVRILAKFRADARSKRGNVPSYGKFGDVPISVKAQGNNALLVSAAPWVMKMAEKKGQPAEWAEIVREEAREAMGGRR